VAVVRHEAFGTHELLGERAALVRALHRADGDRRGPDGRVGAEEQRVREIVREDERAEIVVTVLRRHERVERRDARLAAARRSADLSRTARRAAPAA